MARLSEIARHIVTPEGIVSTGWPAVRNTCNQLGLGFDEWQDGAGRLILAKNADGFYAADTTVLSIPRQVGKTYLIGSIAFALCINQKNTTVVWTAHRFKTAKEAFSTMKGLAGQPKVKAHIERIVNANGDQEIRFCNGSRIVFGARERGFGRGFAGVDVVVFDEAQILGENAMDDIIPATNASPNPLILLVGTPPKPNDPSGVFTMLRQEALSGESQETLYVELSADRGCDPDDQTQWRRANPSYPHRTNKRAMLRMKKNLTPDSFLREGLGIWDEVSRHQAVVKSSVWQELADVGPHFDAIPDALAVDMSHDRHISISACWVEDGSSHIEEVWAGIDTRAAEAWIVQAVRRKRRMPVVIDAMSPANNMIPNLRNKRVLVNQTNAVDMAKACGTFLDAIESDTLTHGGQEAIDEALEGARKRPIGTAGGWGWDRKDQTVNIAPLVSATLALFGASVTRKARSADPESPSGTSRRSRGRAHATRTRTR
jgi:hypothetical protein